MAKTEFSPMLQELDRLEAVLLDAAEIPLSGRRLVREHDILTVINSIRKAFPLAAENHQEEELLDNSLLSSAREGMQNCAPNGKKESRDVMTSHLEASIPRIKSQARLRRKRTVRIMLSDEELSHLDQIAGESGLDRESVFRYLLRSYTDCGNRSMHLPANEFTGKSISRINIADMGVKPSEPIVELVEPNNFDEMPGAVQSIRNGSAVILNLTMMEPDQAQRAVDFAAGATFYGDGHQERVGESIFLFCPANFEVRTSTDKTKSGRQELIEGDSIEGPVSSRPALTQLQEASLQLIRDRWGSDQKCTTPHDLVAELNPSSDPNVSFRLLRRVLFSLAKQGLIHLLAVDEETLSYKPAMEADRADSEAVIDDNG